MRLEFVVNIFTSPPPMEKNILHTLGFWNFVIRQQIRSCGVKYRQLFAKPLKYNLILNPYFNKYKMYNYFFLSRK